MNIYIPNISEKLILNKDCIFSLYPEDWNTNFILQFRPDIIHVMNNKSEWVWTTESWHTFLVKEKEEKAVCFKSIDVCIKKGSVLVVKNISIRTGHNDHNSISLELLENEDGKKGFFWIKLEDAKHIEFDPERISTTSTYDHE